MGCDAVPPLGPSKTTGVAMVPVAPPWTVTDTGMAVYMPGATAITSPGIALFIALCSELPSFTTTMCPVGVGHG